jgi:hypothetical protein
MLVRGPASGTSVKHNNLVEGTESPVKSSLLSMYPKDSNFQVLSNRYIAFATPCRTTPS